MITINQLYTQKIVIIPFNFTRVVEQGGGEADRQLCKSLLNDDQLAAVNLGSPSTCVP